MDLQRYFSVRSTMARTLDDVRAWYGLLGNPQKSMLCVQLAGTNAKGSTAATLASILRCAGYRTGLFTSPALVHIWERFVIDGAMIANDELVLCARHVAAAEQAMGRKFGGFDRMTASALLAFQRQRVQVAVLETGLGGMLDPVTAVDTCLCFLTSISMDHMQVLGNTIEEIANQKCGIMKPGVSVVCHPQWPEVLKFIREYAQAVQCPLLEVQPEYITNVRVNGMEQSMEYRGIPLQLRLAGPHQRINTIAAIRGALELRRQGFIISDEAIQNGVAQTVWPCRLEMVEGILLDGAHNPDAIRVLRAALEECFPGRRPKMLLSVMKDKDVPKIVQGLSGFVCQAVCVKYSDRAIDAGLLAHMLREQGVLAQTVETPAEGLAQLRALCTAPEDLAMVAGSIYLAGDVRSMLTRA